MAITITGMRDRIKALSPSWLQDGTSERLMYVYGLALDALLDKLTQGALGRFPTRASAAANTLTGADRLMQQGLTEADASYAVRLQRAFDSWRFAGSARGVLSELLGYLLAKTPAVRTVATRYNRTTYPGTMVSSQWDEYPAGRDPSAEPIHTLVTASGGNWDWDSLSRVSGSWSWWGDFAVLESVAPNDWIAKEGTWGSGGRWGDGKAWGVDAAASVGRGIVAIVTQRKAAQSWFRFIIVSFDATLFDSTQPAGGGVNPDGHFGRWSKSVGGVRVPARFANARYFTAPA
jgi:hypothetical protein